VSNARDTSGGGEGEGRAVVLLSGGLDSATALAIAHASGQACHCLTVFYGQRHEHEIDAAHRVAEQLGAAEHRVVTIDLRAIGGSALTDEIAVPRGRSDKEMASEIPVTYVPARNLVFMSIAVGYAEVIEARDIFVGVNAVDYSGYPDCRPAFIEAFEKVANLGTKVGVEGGGLRVHAPLLWLTKAQIIKRGTELGVDYALTHSCYDPDEKGAACGHCDSCLLRKKGFAEAGVPDPTTYKK
jgi:7-cyano-7-deazaguanine synthase